MTSQLPSPVNNDGPLHALLAHLLCCDVVPKSVEGPPDEGRLLIKTGPPRGQALGRGAQKSGPQSVPQRFSQSSLTCDGEKKRGKNQLTNKEETKRLGKFSAPKR